MQRQGSGCAHLAQRRHPLMSFKGSQCPSHLLFFTSRLSVTVWPALLVPLSSEALREGFTGEVSFGSYLPVAAQQFDPGTLTGPEIRTGDKLAILLSSQVRKKHGSVLFALRALSARGFS